MGAQEAAENAFDFEILSHNCTGSNPLSMKFPCRLCSIELTDQQMLKNHFTMCHPENLQFQCRTCLMEFEDLSEIVAHMGTHLKTISQCSFCLQRFTSKKDVHNHYVTVHPGVDRSVCLICNKKYSDHSALAKHTMVHTGERPYYCPFCFMTFSLKCSQVVHIRRHTNYRPYKCQYCPKRFFNAGEIRKHIRLHTGEKPYKCTICKTSYAMRETLTKHLTTHKTFNMKCHHCPMRFKDQTLLEMHMSTHCGVKPFKCPLCSETSFYIGSLRRHIISVHTDNLNTNCQICGKVEEDVLSMAQHILTHRIDYVSSQTQWFDYVENASKSQSSSKKKPVLQRKSTSKETRGRQRKYNDTIDYIVTDESYQPGMVEEPKSESVTCDSDANGQEVISRSQTINLKKKGVKRKNRTSTKKRNVDSFNHAVDNSVSSAEELEEKLKTPLNLSCDTLNCEVKNEHDIIKSEIKEEDDEEQNEGVKQEDDEEQHEGVQEEEDDEEYQNEGIQEVDVFLPKIMELECSLCPQHFTCQEELLDHVAIHI